VDSDLRQLLLYQQYDCKLLELEKLSRRLQLDREALQLRRLAVEGKLKAKMEWFVTNKKALFRI
jgi:hypothetical protein